MAIRIDAAGDYFHRTASLPTITSFTMMGWFLGVATGRYGVCLQLGTADGGLDTYQTIFDGAALKLIGFPGTGSDLVGSTVALNTWYHLAMTVAGTGAGQFRIYLNGVLDITGNGNPSNTAGMMWVGNDKLTSSTEWHNGRVAAVKVWSGAVLTASEIQQEMRYYMPVRVANLHTWSPFMAAAMTGNYAGLLTAWTVGGTMTTEDGPPIAWSPPMVPHSRLAVVAASFAPPPFQRPWRLVRRSVYR